MEFTTAKEAGEFWERRTKALAPLEEVRVGTGFTVKP
jgi:hypothetical protein